MTQLVLRVPRSLSIGAGVLLTVGLVFLRVHYVRHAGALWRDEIDSVNVAAEPTFAAVLAHRHLDSFPVAWVTVLHGWIAAGFGETDAGLRGIGLVIGVATIAAIWWSGWRIARRVPLVSLLLLGASPTMVVYGGEVRGYGLAALAVVWCMEAMWTFATRPSGWTFTLAGLAALLTVQSYYGNAFLLFPICAGAAAVAASHRAWRRVWGVAAIGAVAAASLLVDYAGIVTAARDTVIDQGDYGLGARFAVFREGLAPGLPQLAVLWPVAGALAALGCILALRRPHGEERAGDRDRALFAAVTALVALASFCAYLEIVARVATQYWYYVSLMALLAVACDTAVGTLVRRYRHGDVVEPAVVLVFVMVALATVDVAATVRVRMTNLDLVARSIEADGRDDDLVVVLPWYCATTFARYYRGAAPWIAFPDVHFTESARPHRQVAERMTRGEAGVRPELDRIERTLRAGGRVWIVGQPLLPAPGQTPPPLSPAPSGPDGWELGPYLEGWAFQLGALMRSGPRDVWKIGLADVGPINLHENLPVVLLEGWR